MVNACIGISIVELSLVNLFSVFKESMHACHHNKKGRKTH